MFLGTAKDNTQDMMYKGRQRNQNDFKTTCPRGHAYAGNNLCMYRGWRYCRACARVRTQVQAVIVAWDDDAIDASYETFDDLIDNLRTALLARDGGAAVQGATTDK